MKNKLLAVLLAATMALSMTACGGSNSGSTNSDGTSKEETTKTEKTEDVSIEEQELYDQNGIIITATELNMDGMYGPEINVLIENNGTQNITVQTSHTAINDYMLIPLFSTDIAAGKKANGSISFLTEELEAANIDSIGKIDLQFSIIDTDTWENIVTSDMISINTSISETYTQTYDDNGDVLYEANGIRIIKKEIGEDILYGPEVILYIENNSDKGIVVQSRNTSINGFMVEPMLSAEVLAGKKIVTSMTFLAEDLETNGIDTVESIETSFAIINLDTWMDITTSESVTITP
ncbi:MAG: hypothetical protein U0L05_01885 [Schaedlerella sp.]|nr:hypothetical protein [Schaedlerella sp.]